MKILEGLDSKAKEFDLYSLGNRRIQKILQEGSDVQFVF